MSFIRGVAAKSFCAVFAALCGLIFLTDVGWADRKDGVGLGGDGAQATSWYFHPDTGVWSSQDYASPTDAFAYQFQPLCLEDKGHVSPGCVERKARCTEGEKPQLVQWYRGLRGTDTSDWVSFGGSVCVYAQEPLDVMAEIAGRIQHQFEQRPVIAGAVLLQPDEHTLRGAHTNVFAEAQEQIFELVMLGQDVVIRVEPVAYAWTYGDGHNFGPVTDPGGPVPQDRWGEQTATSHVYKETGDFGIILTTTFRGYYSVNGGQEIPIPNTADFDSFPVMISVWRSVVNNYADNCLENPEGAGC
jgi:hypothetical protein